MSSYRMSPWIIIVMINLIILTADAQSNNFVITDFGGVADGKTDNKQAFANAWTKACAVDGGRVIIPKETFFVSSGVFQGPCKGQTMFSIDGTLVASSSHDPNVNGQWLSFNKVDDLTISGRGTFDGNGASTWSRCNSGNCDNRPATLKIEHVTNGLIQSINLVNSKMFHLIIYKSDNVTVKNVSIRAPEDSPNTDGIHVSLSDQISVLESTISTGDDCVSLGDGSRNISIAGVFCGPGHGISIGSLGKYKGEEDVSGITVRNCTLSKTMNGLRIKTWAPSMSSNVVSNVRYEDIIFVSTGNPIIIDQYYCPNGECSHGGESSVRIRGVKYENVRGSSSLATAVNIKCSKSNPCQDINLSGLKITYNGQPSTALCSGDVQFQGSDQVPSHCSK